MESNISINVKTLNSKSPSLVLNYFSPHVLLQSIRQEIAQKLNWNTEDFVLIYKGKSWSNESSLSELLYCHEFLHACSGNLTLWAVLLSRASFEISVVLQEIHSNKKLVMSISSNNSSSSSSSKKIVNLRAGMSVLEVKKFLYNQGMSSLPSKQQKLVFKGRYLEDSCLFGEYFTTFRSSTKPPTLLLLACPDWNQLINVTIKLPGGGSIRTFQAPSKTTLKDIKFILNMLLSFPLLPSTYTFYESKTRNSLADHIRLSSISIDLSVTVFLVPHLPLMIYQPVVSRDTLVLKDKARFIVSSLDYFFPVSAQIKSYVEKKTVKKIQKFKSSNSSKSSGLFSGGFRRGFFNSSNEQVKTKVKNRNHLNISSSSIKKEHDKLNNKTKPLEEQKFRKEFKLEEYPYELSNSNIQYCHQCKKQLRWVEDVVGKCRCNFVFCSLHSHPQAHLCTFNYKISAKKQLRKMNPQVSTAKINRI